LADQLTDETLSNGLFVRLCGRPIFVDTKQDPLEVAQGTRDVLAREGEPDEQIRRLLNANLS